MFKAGSEVALALALVSVPVAVAAGWNGAAAGVIGGAFVVLYAVLAGLIHRVAAVCDPRNADLIHTLGIQVARVQRIAMLVPCLALMIGFAGTFGAIPALHPALLAAPSLIVGGWRSWFMTGRGLTLALDPPRQMQ